MMILLVISTVFSLCYLALSVKVSGGIPESLSATYYALGSHGWLFQVFMASFSLCLLPVWISVSGDSFRCLAFLSCASLLFVAAAPCFRMEPEGKVHYTAAVVCCVCGVLWQVLEGMWDVTLWFAFLFGMLSLQWRDKWCWWLECAVAGSILANLYRMV